MSQAALNHMEPASASASQALDTSAFIRLSGLAVLLACAGNAVLETVEGFAPQPGYIASQYAIGILTVVLLFGLPGVYASRAHGFGVAGLTGFVLIFAQSVMVGVFGNLYGAIVDPWLASEAPNLAQGFGPPPLFAYYNIAEIALVLGTVLIAVPILQGRVSPRWAAVVLLISVPVGAVLFFYTPSLPGNSLAASLLSAVPEVLLWSALAGLGYKTWTMPTGTTD